MKRDSKVVSVDALVAAGVDVREAMELSRLGLPVGQVGFLLCEPKEGDPLVLAYDSDYPLVVRNGQVWDLEETIERLVNTSVTAFIAVLERYERYGHEVRDRSDDEGDLIARRAASDMKKLDPGAFAPVDAYWPIICDQMIDGNL